MQIGNYQFSFIHFKKHIIKGIREFILPDGNIALLPEEWFEKYSELLTLGTKQDEGIRLQKANFKLLDSIEGGEICKELNKLQLEYIDKKEYPNQQELKLLFAHIRKKDSGGCYIYGKITSEVALPTIWD